MIKYIIYTQKNCTYCAEAKSLLDDMEEVYEERVLDTAEKVRRFKEEGHKTVPQIFKPDLKLVEDTKPPKIGALSGEKKVISFAEKRALVKGRKLLEDKED